WIDAQKENVLDAPYYHVVFTVPVELNPIIYSNQKLLYDALYHAASSTLDELAKDSKYLGADIGYICILHTWGSAMNYHPHIHTIVLGGGLDKDSKWKDTGGKFFLPYGVIAKVFRGKYLCELKSLWNDSRLEFHGTAEKYQNHYCFKGLL
ncbi:IS91 family transposase, partial [Roseburia inulinivorans]|uniref:IS91 family transposase n=1 Tax=Roseburia inulinivorans TaxID=360807 RepID=UPI001C01337B